MLKIIGLVVGVLIAAVRIYAATQPDVFRVQRSTSIKAPGYDLSIDRRLSPMERLVTL